MGGFSATTALVKEAPEPIDQNGLLQFPIDFEKKTTTVVGVGVDPNLLMRTTTAFYLEIEGKLLENNTNTMSVRFFFLRNQNHEECGFLRTMHP